MIKNSNSFKSAVVNNPSKRKNTFLFLIVEKVKNVCYVLTIPLFARKCRQAQQNARLKKKYLEKYPLFVKLFV